MIKPHRKKGRASRASWGLLLSPKKRWAEKTPTSQCVCAGFSLENGPEFWKIPARINVALSLKNCAAAILAAHFVMQTTQPHRHAGLHS
jgi:hypothetical protein